jgi:galactose mutarotase-like enzyme
MLSSADKSLGCSVQFDTQTLPYLNVWKNTAAREDGNVVGLEPATGFPNPRSIEEEQGRVVQLAAGESKAFQLRFVPLATSQDVAQAKARIDAIAGRAK